jgi:transposase-like protein
MTKRKPAKRKTTPKRKRGVAIQVYVSREERADIRMIARRRGVTLSTLVRDWIRRSAAAAVAREPKPVAVDPRQLAILDAFEGAAPFKPACDECPFAHLSIHDSVCASCPNVANA